MKHIIKVAMTFTADVEVEAENYTQARAAVLDHFACVGPSWHCSTDKILAWDAQVHPEKKVLTPVDVIGFKHEDGTYRVEEPSVWPNVTELCQRAKNTRNATDLAIVGVNLVDLFDLEPAVASLTVRVDKDHEHDDQGVTHKRYNISITVDCGNDEEDVASTIEDNLHDVIVGDDLGKAIYDCTTEGKFTVNREHLAPFLKQDRISGIAVMRHLASLPGSHFDPFVKIEVQYV